MAHSQVRSASGPAPTLARMSYSKIAAMPAPNSFALQNNVPKPVHDPQHNSQEVPIQPKRPEVEQPEIRQTPAVQMPIDHLQFPLGNLSLVDAPVDISFSEHNADSGDSYEEDRSQVSTSSLNKPQSFDTKSLASVTTFAMDDKESIRPDDSASVRAVDDDHPHPGLSRNSSFQHELEQQQQQQQQQQHRSTLRPLTSNVTIPSRRFPTLVNPPKFGNFGSLPISPVLECQDLASQKSSIPVLSPDEPRDATTVTGVSPDEKLMEALASAKDRLPLLQLEEKILSFIANISANVLELPPQNGFTRLLTHRLADYYGLAHNNTEDNSSVRVSRCGTQNLPTPLSELAKSISVGSTNGPSSTAVKIMRREQLGGRHFSAGNSTAPSSSVPSKTASENGNEGRSEDGLTSPTESTPSRDKSKLTREEREAQYKAVRDRIFGDMPESVASEIIFNGENSAEMSRSSSSSGKKKHKKYKQPKDDSFEARSAFVQSYAPLQNHYNTTYADHSMAAGYPTSPVPFDSSMYGSTPTQTFPGFDGHMPYGGMQPYNPNIVQQYGPGDWQALQTTQNGYFMYPHGVAYQQGPNIMMPPNQMMSAQMSDWYAAQYSHNMPGLQQMNSGSHYPTYGPGDQRSPPLNDQLGRPYHRPHSTSSIHPNHQGSKGTKSLFNPQTRSFVPNNAESRSGHRGGRGQKQGRNSGGPYAQSPVANSNGNLPKHEDSLKLRYGTPPSLPKKPPPSDAKQFPEVGASPVSSMGGSSAQEITPVAAERGCGPLVVNGGTDSA